MTLQQSKMKRLILLLAAGLMLIQHGYTNKTSGNENIVEVTYIANEDFLIKVNNKKILIDALFGDKEYGFCDIPDEETINAMLKSEDDFKNIDIIATTHNHIDHFYVPFVAGHLMNNRKGIFISTAQSINQIKESQYYEEITTQLVEITPDSLTYADTVINEIEVRVYRLIHGVYFVTDPNTGEKKNRHKDMQNLGFLFNVDGIKIFHCGDSNPYNIFDYEQFRLDKEEIDIAFLGRGFMWQADSQGVEILRNYIQPKHIILMHIHHDENQKFIDVADEMKHEFPSVMIFEEKMATKEYVIEQTGR